MKYAFMTVYKSWPLIFAGAVLCAGLLMVLIVICTTFLLSETIAVPVLTPVICPTETDFVVREYSYTLPGETSIGLKFACVDARGQDQGGSELLVLSVIMGSLTGFFFTCFSLWLFISTWKSFAKSMQTVGQL